MLLDQREYHLFVSLKGLDRCRFILTYQPAIAGHIGSEDRRQLAFEILSDHGITPQTKSLQKGTDAPWRLHFQNLRVAFFHGHLKKVKVVLKVNRRLNCVGIKTRIDLLEKMSRFFM